MEIHKYPKSHLVSTKNSQIKSISVINNINDEGSEYEYVETGFIEDMKQRMKDHQIIVTGKRKYVIVKCNIAAADQYS